MSIVQDQIVPPSNAAEQVIDLIFGRWRSQILHAGVALGVFDALTDGPRASARVAETLQLDPPHTYRLMRALGSLGLLEEGPERVFGLSEAGRLLTKAHPQSLRGMTLLEEGPEHYAIWKHLSAMIADGRQNAFVREFGRMAFDHAVADQRYGQVFDQAMNSYSSAQAEWVLEALQHHDFSTMARLCDVGGGQGYMLCSLLARYPHLQGTVLERGAVVAHTAGLWAQKLGLEGRCTYVAGDMFAAVPPADAYFMKLILHDWNDEECVRILERQRQAAPSGGRVFIVEHVIPGPETPHFAKLFDIHMMCWGTGRERTEDEYAGLLERAGWTYAGTWYPASRAMGVVEGRAR